MDRTYKMDFDSDQSLKEWAKDKPLSILQLDPADRAVLRIAGLRKHKIVADIAGEWPADSATECRLTEIIYGSSRRAAVADGRCREEVSMRM
ncbi:hypothetical protein J6590_027825 [Homalodisca vitripennis]|nr:hypothetical protein J6590_027825 [Homalodisca vitripennis]